MEEIFRVIGTVLMNYDNSMQYNTIHTTLESDFSIEDLGENKEETVK